MARWMPSVLFLLLAAGTAAAQPPPNPYAFSPPGETAPVETRPAPAPAPARAAATLAVSAAPVASVRAESWTAFGFLEDRAGHKGGRLQVDLLGGEHLALGIAASMLDVGDQVMSVTVPRASGVVYAAATFQILGPLHVRAQLGYGGAVSASASEDAQTMAVTTTTSTSRVLEGALLGHLELGASWAVFGGPVVQSMATPLPNATGTAGLLVLGLQHR